MKRFLLWASVSFMLILAASFTTVGKFIVLILGIPFFMDGVEGFKVFWFVALLAGVPFLGFAALLLWPGKDGRLASILALAGLWIGLFGGAATALAINQGTP